MDFFIGGIAGAISRTLTAPLERLKILRQNKLDDGNYLKKKAVRYMFKTEGIRGLFKGNLMNCSRYSPQSAVQFHIFNYCNKNLEELIPNNFNRQLISGGIGGMCAYTTIYPIELVRVRYSMQTQINVPIISGLWDGYKHIYKTDKMFFRGWCSTMVGVVPLMALNFTIFNQLKDHFNKNDKKIKNFVFGSIAGITSLFIVYPTELIRRRLQLQNFYDKYPVYHNSKDVIIKVYQNEGGIKGFYKGLKPALTRICLSNGIFFMSLEFFNSLREKL